MKPFDYIIGTTHGKWRVAAIHYRNMRPFAWIVRINEPNVQARISVEALICYPHLTCLE